MPRRHKHGKRRCRTAKYYTPVTPRLANPDEPASFTYVREPQLKRLRAIAILKDRVEGMSEQDAAEKYRVARSTIQRTMSWAKRANLLVEAEDQVLQEFVPQAGVVLAEAMQGRVTIGKSDDDAGVENPLVDLGPSEQAIRVALAVYQGTGIFRKPGAKSPSNPVGDAGDDLAKHIQSLRAKAALDEATLDGDLLESSESGSDRQLTPGPRIVGRLTAGETATGGSPVDGADGSTPAAPGTPIGAWDPQAGTVDLGFDPTGESSSSGDDDIDAGD